MRTYRNVKFDPRKLTIEGEQTIGRSFCKFSACIELMAISLAMEVLPRSISTFMSFADGYGEPGCFPGGYDWSGIRDSSKPAVKKMFFAARHILDNHKPVLFKMGLPKNLVAVLSGRVTV